MVLLLPFVSNPDSLRDLTIFIISSISSFEIINAVVRKAESNERPDPSIFFWIAASAADIPVDNPYGIKTVLANRHF